MYWLGKKFYLTTKTTVSYHPPKGKEKHLLLCAVSYNQLYDKSMVGAGGIRSGHLGKDTKRFFYVYIH